MTDWIRDWWSRTTAGVALAVVAVVTGIISYIHITELTLAEHQSSVVAHLYPFGIDGLVILGGIALLTIGKKHPVLGWLGVIPGVAASLFANWESGIRWGYPPAAWATVPAASFALSVMLFERWLAAQLSDRSEVFPAVQECPDPDAHNHVCPEHEPEHPGTPEPETPEVLLRKLVDSGSRRQLADFLGRPHGTDPNMGERYRPPSETVSPDPDLAPLNGGIRND